MCCVLVVSYGALRCVQLINEIRGQINDDAAPTVAKLWSKHLKIEEQKTYLNTHYAGVGCGTPSRIAKLCEDGLDLDRTRLVVIDCQANVKDQTIFTLPETKADVISWIAAECFPRMMAGKMRLVMM